MAGVSVGQEYERLGRARTGRNRSSWIVLLGVAAVLGVGGATLSQALLRSWWIGALFCLVATSNVIAPTQRQVAWRKGAEGERVVGRALDALGQPTRALHDLLLPGSRANIDHILVASSGVWTIDAMNYKGKIEVRRRGRELWISGRNCWKLLQQADREAAVVRATLDAAGLHSVPVQSALCFVGVKWPLLFRPRAAEQVRLAAPRSLRKLANGQASLTDSQIERITRALSDTLAPATKPRRNT